MSRLTYTLLTLLARAGKNMELADLVAAIGDADEPVHERLASLKHQGWVLQRGSRWTITETGRIAAEAETVKRSEALYVRGWQTLRILKAANVDELVTLAARPNERHASKTLQSYFSRLSRVGLVVRAGSHTPARYALLDDIGPLAPQVRSQRREVYEPNGNRTLPLPGRAHHD